MFLSIRIERALAETIRLHAKQKRKGDNATPYAVHPISVAMLLSRYTDDEDIIVAGLLHDALENTRYSPKEIKKNFGERVLGIVKEVSEKDPKASWEKRKMECLVSLKVKSEEACLVICADKIHNLKSLSYAYARLGEDIWKRFNATKEKKIWYYESIYNEIKSRFRHGLIKELNYALKEIKGIKPERQKPPERCIGPFELVEWDHFSMGEGEKLCRLGSYDKMKDAIKVANELTKEAKGKTIEESSGDSKLTYEDLWYFSKSYGVYDSTFRMIYWADWFNV